MLDAAEMAEFEAWKMRKLTDAVDISVAAFNAEREAPALAYEAGVRRGVKEAVGPGDHQKEVSTIERVIASNPYRGSGMAGERPPRKAIS